MTILLATAAVVVAGLATGLLNKVPPAAGLDAFDVIVLVAFDAIPFDDDDFVARLVVATGFGITFMRASLAGIDSTVPAAPRFNGNVFKWIKSLIERLRLNA